MQTFENVNTEFQIPLTGNQVQIAMANTILNGSLEKAVEILHISGGNFLIEKTGFTTLDEVVGFYHARRGYFRTLMQSYGITHVKCPGCVECMTLSTFCKQHKLKKSQDKVELESGKIIEIPGTARRVFYDARVVLAYACLAFMNRKIVPDSNAERVLNILEKSNYYEEAMELVKKKIASEHQQLEAVYKYEDSIVSSSNNAGISNVIAERGRTSPEFNVRFNENGDVVIPLDSLTKIIQVLMLNATKN